MPPKKTSLKSKRTKDDDEPFPEFARPSPTECALAVQVLGDLHGTPTPGKQTMGVLDSLVRTILSQNTTDKNSRVAFLSLKEHFPKWREVYDAVGTGRVEASIRHGGLADIKARNIHVILDYLLTQHADKCEDGGQEPSYEWLRKESDEFCKAELSQHKGVGPKTVSCVMMFNLMRPEFPVDTHVWHIAKKMNWTPQASSAETCYLHMNKRVPDDLKYPLHILLVEHGKRCTRCAKNGKLQLPEEGGCPLVNFQEQLVRFDASAPSPSKAKDFVPWYVKTEGCEMVKGEFLGAPNSTSRKRKAGEKDVKIKVESDSFVEVKTEAKAEIKVEPAVKVEAQEATPSVPHRIKKKKILQHLDMQG